MQLFHDIERPLEPEFILHAYARLAGNIMRRTWQDDGDI